MRKTKAHPSRNGGAGAAVAGAATGSGLALTAAATGAAAQPRPDPDSPAGQPRVRRATLARKIAIMRLEVGGDDTFGVDEAVPGAGEPGGSLFAER